MWLFFDRTSMLNGHKHVNYNILHYIKAILFSPLKPGKRDRPEMNCLPLPRITCWCNKKPYHMKRAISRQSQTGTCPICHFYSHVSIALFAERNTEHYSLCLYLYIHELVRRIFFSSASNCFKYDWILLLLGFKAKTFHRHRHHALCFSRLSRVLLKWPGFLRRHISIWMP